MQAKPFGENQSGSLARNNAFDERRLAWDVSGPGTVGVASEPAMSQQPVMSQQRVDSRASVRSKRQRRQRKKTSNTALVSSRYLSNTTVCATDKSTNKKKPFHLYGWGNTRPVGRTSFLGRKYMKSKNTAANSVPSPALLSATHNQTRGQQQVEAIVPDVGDDSQQSVFAQSTFGQMMQHKHKQSRMNALQDNLAPSFSSGSRRPIPPGVPTGTASRAYARQRKKQNSVIDSMVSFFFVDASD